MPQTLTAIPPPFDLRTQSMSSQIAEKIKHRLHRFNHMNQLEVGR